MTQRGPAPGRPNAKHGEAVKAKYGPAFYRIIGKKGGEAVRDRLGGTEYFQQIGQYGGNATKANQGSEFYKNIGRKGGMAKRGAK